LAVVVLPEPIIPSVKIGRAALTGQGHAALGAPAITQTHALCALATAGNQSSRTAHSGGSRAF
jgi:hypothetical protein